MADKVKVDCLDLLLRYYSLSSIRPVSIFPRLLKFSTHLKIVMRAALVFWNQFWKFPVTVVMDGVWTYYKHIKLDFQVFWTIWAEISIFCSNICWWDVFTRVEPDQMEKMDNLNIYFSIWIHAKVEQWFFTKANKDYDSYVIISQYTLLWKKSWSIDKFQQLVQEFFSVTKSIFCNFRCAL